MLSSGRERLYACLCGSGLASKRYILNKTNGTCLRYTISKLGGHFKGHFYLKTNDKKRTEKKSFFRSQKFQTTKWFKLYKC